MLLERRDMIFESWVIEQSDEYDEKSLNYYEEYGLKKVIFIKIKYIMKLTKENVYVDLRGKSEEELTDLYNFLESVGEKTFRDYIEWFLSYSNLEGHFAHLSYRCDYANWGNTKTENKQEVTIQQLKEILQPMETLQEKAIRLENELNEVKQQIEEENKIKEDDWVFINESDIIFKVKENGFRFIDYRHKKITNTELIKLLEQEIK